MPAETCRFWARSAASTSVALSCRAAMQELKKGFPPGVDATIIYDPNVFIEKSIHEVIVSIFVAILLVVGVVFLFLQNWRATIIPIIAIPVSLVGTFTILALFGIWKRETYGNVRDYLAWTQRRATSSGSLCRITATGRRITPEFIIGSRTHRRRDNERKGRSDLI